MPSTERVSTISWPSTAEAVKRPNCVSPHAATTAYGPAFGGLFHLARHLSHSSVATTQTSCSRIGTVLQLNVAQVRWPQKSSPSCSMYWESRSRGSRSRLPPIMRDAAQNSF